ncbi:hypothetical protein B0H94_11551 [Salsuginibacillus halophilus]|uniref:Uncharacterized protein n=1 Tax=Salsuginibacillus halophilus TaxID=517424 RepID=A0A2P8H887_9BACI|nr:BH0509 family protein [Salsuginibacillus halophilus]PSL42447.1 hypothetical protein B0H94_11551 [Salsuginibacillus halophilus]
MMNRRERENMITFISRMRGLQEQKLMVMTDAEVEHIYEATYREHEHTE